MAVSMREIAKLAGCSAPAVSAVLKGSSQTIRVSPERAEKIREIAAQLGYRTQWRSTILRDGRTRLVGLVGTKDRITKFHNNWLLRGLEDELALHGLALTFIQTVPGHTDMLVDGRFDGCLIDYVVQPDQIAAIRGAGLPGLIINAEPREGIPAVRLDEHSAMGDLINHLTDLGHRRICYLDHHATSDISRRWTGEQQSRRFRAWEKCRSSHPLGSHWSVLPIDSNIYDHAQDVVARSGLRELLTKPIARRPTAFVAFDATMAFVLADFANQLGLRCPDDFSVVSMADADMLKLTRVPITAIAEDFQQVGRLSAQHLHKLINVQHPDKRKKTSTRLAEVEMDVLVRSPLIERASTGAAPA
jgi:DNA-binding LacI/PurR family transcriptional regulator